MLKLAPIASGAVAGILTSALMFGLNGGATPKPSDERPRGAVTSGDSTSVSAASATGEEIPDEQLRARVALMSEELEALRSRLELVETERQAVAMSDVSTDGTPLDSLASVAPEEQRQLVLDVLEQQRLEEEAERRQEREEREQARAQDKADRIAEALGLTSVERDTLAGIYAEEGVRRGEIFETMRDAGPGDRDAIRDSFDSLREWTEGELELQLGADLAGQIETYESENRSFRGFGGGFSRGGGRGN
ncbi:MAG: hypothetical protein ACYSWX_04760 [Planctomycetota bacterium]|jgi:hypothetical protein